MSETKYCPDIDLACDMVKGMLRKIEGPLHRRMFLETLVISCSSELKGDENESSSSGDAVQQDS